MKSGLSLGWLGLALLVASCTVSSQGIQLTTPPAPSLAASTLQNLYQSDRFGFRFSVPQDFILVPVTPNADSEILKPIQILELWQKADHLNRQVLPESPPLISLYIYKNPQRLSLKHWKEELSQGEDKAVKVAGQEAIAYTATGLYEFDHILVSSPDQRFVYRFQVGYIDAEAPIRQTFQQVITSFQFYPMAPTDP